MTEVMTEKPTEKPIKAAKVKRIVGVQQAAAYCGVSRWTMRTWILEGKIPFIRYPGRGEADLRGAKLDLNDLDLFIERNKDRN